MSIMITFFKAALLTSTVLPILDSFLLSHNLTIVSTCMEDFLTPAILTSRGAYEPCKKSGLRNSTLEVSNSNHAISEDSHTGVILH